MRIFCNICKYAQIVRKRSQRNFNFQLVTFLIHRYLPVNFSRSYLCPALKGSKNPSEIILMTHSISVMSLHTL